MEQPVASGTSQCPRDDNHDSHYWRFEDEPNNVFRACNGLLIPNVDVYERPVNGAR